MEQPDRRRRPRVVRGERGPRVVRGAIEPPDPPEGRLAELTARLGELDAVPLSEHPDLFEELDALLAEELAALDEV